MNTDSRYYRQLDGCDLDDDARPDEGAGAALWLLGAVLVGALCWAALILHALL